MTYERRNKGTCSVMTKVELNLTIPLNLLRCWGAATAT